MTSDAITIGDLSIPIVSSEEAEDADFVVCVLASEPTQFDDNLTGVCSDCGRAVQFRTYVPTRPPKICVPCMLDRVQGGRA